MSESSQDRRALLEAIHSSHGMEHVNRSHQRTFTLNIFRMNAQELIEIARRVHDPDEGLRLMAVANREAGNQTHREVTRRVHNFVAGALTLVEHTRVFMREHYLATSVLARYQARVDSDFRGNPLARFVQDLRNYILHNGLPNTEMYMHFESKPHCPEGAALECGIHIGAAPLLNWSKWSAPARQFIASCGEYVDIRAFTESYTERVSAFHLWLQDELDRFHMADLDELRRLQERLDRLAPIVEQTEIEIDEEVNEPEYEFSFAAERATALEAAAAQILRKVRRIEPVRRRGGDFASERPAVMIAAEKMITDPLVWVDESDGRRAFAMIHRDDALYGLAEEAFAEMIDLVEGVLASSWARKMLSRGFVEKTTIEWLQGRFEEKSSGSFVAFVEKASKDAVQPLEFWAPISNLEIETSFAVGPAEVATINAKMIDGLECQALEFAPRQYESVTALFGKIRDRMQGLAAVVVRTRVEAGKIEEEGVVVARLIVAMLRYFSPAAQEFPASAPYALLGEEVVPKSNILVLGDGSFSYKESLLMPNSGWQISIKVLQEMRPSLDVIGKLVRPEGLNAFNLAVRSSLLLFSTGATFANPIERLAYTLSSLEALLLRHSADAANFNLARRIGFLLTRDVIEREKIARNVYEAYRLRARQTIEPLLRHEMNSVETFIRIAHHVIGVALGNVDRFEAPSEFITAIEPLGG